MSLIEYTLDGKIDKVQVAVNRITSFDPITNGWSDDPYYVAYSGGKDSDALRILFSLANVKHELWHNHTTVDAPETVYYIRSIPGINIDYPDLTMWKLIVKKRMPPTRMVRYCCRYLKEHGGNGRFVSTGVRWDESNKRRKNRGSVEIMKSSKSTSIILNADNDESRRTFESCLTQGKQILNPIIDWSDEDVWELLNHYSCKSNPLYQCGFKRVGCVGCPMAGSKGKYRLLIGGSPCTNWSIAQKNNRETIPKGIGWESFCNYVIAKEKYRPDYFLYENNKSMSIHIRNAIDHAFNKPYSESDDWELSYHHESKQLTYWKYRNTESGTVVQISRVLINSARVSAQNRERYYWTDIPDITLPEDKGILLRDVLESGITYSEKGYPLRANCGGVSLPHDMVMTKRSFAAEPVCVAQRGRYESTGNRYRKVEGDEIVQVYEAREDGKTNTLTTVQKDTLIAQPVILNDIDGKAKCIRSSCEKDGIRNMVGNHTDKRTCIAEPVRIGTIENSALSPKHDSQQYRVYSPDGKAVTQCGNAGGMGAKTGLYACPVDTPEVIYKKLSRSERVIYEVHGGQITIKGKQYPIKLADGYYIIRKLTILECKRLQTVPDGYLMPCSATQNYRMLGNGWTVDVICHILSHIPGIKTSEVKVLSMYDGMSCGQIALERLGTKVLRYYAVEIDKHAIRTTQANYPDTVQLGDAFQVRDDKWNIPEHRQPELIDRDAV